MRSGDRNRLTGGNRYPGVTDDGRRGGALSTKRRGDDSRRNAYYNTSSIRHSQFPSKFRGTVAAHAAGVNGQILDKMRLGRAAGRYPQAVAIAPAFQVLAPDFRSEAASFRNRYRCVQASDEIARLATMPMVRVLP